MINAKNKFKEGWIMLLRPFKFGELTKPLQKMTVLYAYSEKPIITMELTENRKVFEIVGSKLKIEPSKEQLSGLGFAETQKGHIIVRVEGKIKRMLKVNI